MRGEATTMTSWSSSVFSSGGSWTMGRPSRRSTSAAVAWIHFSLALHRAAARLILVLQAAQCSLNSHMHVLGRFTINRTYAALKEMLAGRKESD